MVGSLHSKANSTSESTTAVETGDEGRTAYEIVFKITLRELEHRWMRGIRSRMDDGWPAVDKP